MHSQVTGTKTPRRPANQFEFERRREQLIQGLLAASTPAEREAMERGRVEGRKLRQEIEVL